MPWFLEFFMYFGDQAHIQYGVCEDLLHSVGCNFVLFTVFFTLQKLLSLKR